MNQQFYVAVNGQKTGPFIIDELATKQITKETLVWTEGLDNWTKADHIPLLKDLLRATPPPLPKNESQTNNNTPPPPISNIENKENFGYQIASKLDRFWASLVNGIIISIPILIFGGLDDAAQISMYDPAWIFTSTILFAAVGGIFYLLWSGNIGHKILGLKVISSNDGSDQNKFIKGALREGLKNVFEPFIIPVIWLLWDNKNQNLYDKILNTIVVKKKAVN